jgi:hypothetical protein
MRSGLSAVRTPGVMAVVLALGLSGAYAAEASGRVAPNQGGAAKAKKKKHPKKRAPKHRAKRTPHHKSVPSMKIDSAVQSATSGPDFIGAGSAQADVKITVTTPTPQSDGVMVYVTKGGCFQKLKDANQYNTDQFGANQPSSVGDHSVAGWLNQGAPAGGASGTFDAVNSVGAGYSTACATIYNQHVDSYGFVTFTPYFTVQAPLTSG